MTPKEKAKDILGKYSQLIYHPTEHWRTVTIQCALIAIDEMIAEVYNISHQYTAIYDITTMSYNYQESKELKFWQEVKKEIEKL